MNDQDFAVLFSRLIEALEGLGLQASPDVPPPNLDGSKDAYLALCRGTSSSAYALQLKHLGTLTSLRPEPANRARGAPVLVGATYVSPRSADSFRRAGIQYIDVAGNASIHFGDALIDVRGRPPSKDLMPVITPSSGNLFSTARAQVGFAVLQWPRLWNATQRDVAKAAGVSLGKANETLLMLRQAGFGPDGHRVRSELLDLWVAAYPSGLARRLELTGYRGRLDDVPKFATEEADLDEQPIVSGEMAAREYVRAATLTLYVERLDPHMALKLRWRSDGHRNISVRRKFWKAPRNADLSDDARVFGLLAAPTVMVYADLMASDDPRVRVAAQLWRDRNGGLQQGS